MTTYDTLYARYLELVDAQDDDQTCARAEEILLVCTQLSRLVPAGHCREQWEIVARAYELY